MQRRGTRRRINRVEAVDDDDDIVGGSNVNLEKNVSAKEKEKEKEAGGPSYSQYTSYTEYLESLHKEHEENQDIIDDDWEIVYCLMRILVIVVPITIAIILVPVYYNCNAKLSETDDDVRVTIALLQPFLSITLSILIATFTQPKQAINVPVDISQKRDRRPSGETTRTGYDSDRISHLDEDGLDDEEEGDNTRPQEQDFRTLARALARAKALYRSNKEYDLTNDSKNAETNLNMNKGENEKKNEDDAKDTNNNNNNNGNNDNNNDDNNNKDDGNRKTEATAKKEGNNGDDGDDEADDVDDDEMISSSGMTLEEPEGFTRSSKVSAAVKAARPTRASSSASSSSSSSSWSERVVVAGVNRSRNAGAAAAKSSFVGSDGVEGFGNWSSNKNKDDAKAAEEGTVQSKGGILKRRGSNKIEPISEDEADEEEEALAKASGKSPYRKPAIILIVFFTFWILLLFVLLGVFHFAKGC